MTLEEYAQIAKIVTSFVSVILLTISVVVAISVYRWRRKKEQIDTARRLSEDLRHYNELVLANEDLQEFIASSHRWGRLEKHDVIRMYRYFILFNISLSLFAANKKGAVDPEIYNVQINNTANVTYTDREFVKQHVFPRGYPKEFCTKIGLLWEQINLNGTL